MDNDPKIPDGWAMPDDLAKKVSEGLNSKTRRPEAELADALEENARDIALIETDPQEWGGLATSWNRNFMARVLELAMNIPFY